MAKFEEVLAPGLTIRESANDGSDFTNPTADYRRLFLGEDGLLHLKDSSGTVTDIAASGGAVATDAIWDAKGDLAGGTGANTAVKLTVGSNGTVLTADSGETTGMKWSAPAAGGMTLITDTTLGSDTASFDFTSIPGTYKHLRVIVTGRTINSGTDVDFITLRLNNDSGANYDGYWMQFYNGFTTASGAEDAAATSWAHSMIVPGATSTTGAVATCEFLIADYAGTTFHKVVTMHGFDVKAESSTNIRAQTGGAVWHNTAAVTRVTLTGAGNSWKTGSRASLYGIS